MKQASTSTPLNQAREEYLLFLANYRNSSRHTLRSYRTTLLDLTRFLEEQIYNSAVLLDYITVKDLQDYIQYRRERGNSPRTVNNALVCLRSFWSYAVKRGLTTNNPTLLLEKVHYTRKERIYLTEKELKRFLDKVDRPIIYAACETIIHTGLRVSELLNLQVTDVNFERRTIFVAHGKGDKQRTIPISNTLYPILSDYYQNQRPIRESNLFFATAKSGKLSAQYLNQCISEAAKNAGLPHISAHILRHSFASALVRNNANLVCVQRLLGHSDLKTTSVYLHANREDLMKTVNILSV